MEKELKAKITSFFRGGISSAKNFSQTILYMKVDEAITLKIKYILIQLS